MERDFSVYIQDATRDFTGRTWFFQALNDWLAHSAVPIFLLTGEPGAGKTAIAARLAQFSRGEAEPGSLPQLQPGFLSGIHFCSARDVGWSSPHSFVESLALQLAKRHPVFQNELLRQAARAGSGITITTHQTLHGSVTAGANVTGVRIEHLHFDRLSAVEGFTRALREPLEVLLRTDDSQQVVILVDALDEALSDSDISIVQLLAGMGHMPPGWRLILTSRPEPRVQSKFLQAMQLALADQRYASATAEDVRAYVKLRIAQAPPLAAQAAALSAEGRRAAETQIAAAGNLQYLAFLLDEMAQGQRTLTALEGLPAGLDGLYHDSLARVTDAHPGAWEQRFEPIVGVLSVAQAGLTHVQLQNFTGQTEVVRNLKTLWQFIQPTQRAGAAEKLYQLYHQSLADFLQRPDLAGQDWQTPNSFYSPARQWHLRIADYYWAAHRNSWAHCDEYGLLYLPLHLRQLDAYERLCTLVDCRDWYEAKLALTAHEDAYLADLNAVWEMARERDAELARQGQPLAHLGREVRCALAMSSLGGLSEEIPPALLRAMVSRGIWALVDATTAARRNPDAYRKALALVSLNSVAPNTETRAALAREGLQATPDIYEPWSRAEARFKLAKGLLGEERERVEREAFDEMLVLTSENRKTDTLAWIAALLPETFLPEAFTTALHFEDGYNQEKALAALAPRLSPDLLQQAIDLLADKQAQGSPALLAAQLGHLPEAERAGRARLILEQVSALDDEYRRDLALKMLAPHLSGELLTEAALLARRRQHFHSDCLTAFARRFAELGDAEEALQLLHFLSLPVFSSLQQVITLNALLDVLSPAVSGPQQATTLNALLDVLSAAHLPALREIVQEMTNPYWRAEALGLLACAFPGNVEDAVLQGILAARSLNDADHRAFLLVVLAAYLPEESKRLAFALMPNIKDLFVRTNALAILAPHLPADLLAPALELATCLGEDRYEVQAVKSLVPYLPEPRLEQALEHSWYWDVHEQLVLAPILSPFLSSALRKRAIEQVRWHLHIAADDQSALLCALVPKLGHCRHTRCGFLDQSVLLCALVPELLEEELQQMLTTARTMQGDNASYGLRLLATLLPHLPDAEQSAVFAEAWAILRSTPSYLIDEPTHAALAIYLARKQRFTEAFSFLENLNSPREWMAKALTEMVPWLSKEWLPKTRELARNLAWPTSVHVLAQLQPRMAEDPILELTDRLLAHRSRLTPTDLAPLLPHLPTEKRRELLCIALTMTEELVGERERVRALGVLGPYLLADWETLPLDQLYALFAGVLRAAAGGSRKDLLDTLRLLTPVVIALGGAQVAEDIFTAVQEAGHWWQ